VSIVEGDSFGAPGTVRLSYATSDALIVAAVDRIAKAIAELS
jgi:aspartate aminotransferase